MADARVVQEFTVAEYREHLASGRADLPAFYDGQLEYARGVQARIEAFASLDERVIRLQAEHRQAERARGEPLGALYGVPVAIKDIVDTIDFPTEFGSPIHAGRYPIADATIVRRLRDAGAVVFGKAVTTEFATFHPGPTRNPHDPDRTPGGSSSGSAAAVAAGIVPVAIGTQTNGSVIRPASFCGVYGFKPSIGTLPRTGIFTQSPTLDQPGLFARCVEDLALVAGILSGDDGEDPASLGLAPRRLHEVCTSEPPVAPTFCFVDTPWWGRMEPEAREACDAFVELMQGVVVRAELPAVVGQAVEWHRWINDAELAFALRREHREHADRLSDALRAKIESGLRVPVVDYLAARDRIPHVASAFDAWFERFDAILTPAALGAAPRGLASTGDPIMQTVWSFAGLPAVTMPLLTLSGGMPFGVQAIGAPRNDARLLRSCRWLVETFVERSRDA